MLSCIYFLQTKYSEAVSDFFADTYGSAMMMDGSPDYLDDRSMYNGLNPEFMTSAYAAARYVTQFKLSLD